MKRFDWEKAADCKVLVRFISSNVSPTVNPAPTLVAGRVIRAPYGFQLVKEATGKYVELDSANITSAEKLYNDFIPELPEKNVIAGPPSISKWEDVTDLFRFVVLVFAQGWARIGIISGNDIIGTIPGGVFTDYQDRYYFTWDSENGAKIWRRK